MSTKTTPNYGTIPTTTAPTTSSQPSYLSRATATTRTFISNHRPWREFVSPYSFSLPTSYTQATSRIRRNLNYFRFNYSLITLITLFLSLLYHPISMIVFLVVFVLWMLLYFARETPVVVFGREVDDRFVIIGLFLVTVVGLVLTRVGVNVLVALSVSVFLVLLHAAFREVDDLWVVEDDDVVDGSARGLVDVVQGQPLRPTYARVV